MASPSHFSWGGGRCVRVSEDLEAGSARAAVAASAASVHRRCGCGVARVVLLVVGWGRAPHGDATGSGAPGPLVAAMPTRKASDQVFTVLRLRGRPLSRCR